MRIVKLLPLLILSAAALPLAAATAAPAPPPVTVTYVDGSANLIRSGKPARPLDFGEKLAAGDTVRTGADGLVDLDRGGVALRISPKTVFRLEERVLDGRRRDVVSVVVGAVKMRYDRLGGDEPLIRTTSCAAAVRGTEITVLSGEDGGTLIAVDSGRVEVASAGGSVSLGAGEGVEVRPGEAPGSVFAVNAVTVDYERWNAARLDALAADPRAALADLRRLLDAYAAEAAAYDRVFRDQAERLAAERAVLRELRATEGEAAFEARAAAVATPLSLEAAANLLNARYQALAGFSLRRYVAGRLYLRVKPESLVPARQEEWRAFLADYRAFLDAYERTIVPHLVDADY